MTGTVSFHIGNTLDSNTNRQYYLSFQWKPSYCQFEIFSHEIIFN